MSINMSCMYDMSFWQMTFKYQESGVFFQVQGFHGIPKKKLDSLMLPKGGTCKICWDLMSKVAISPVIRMMMEMVMAPCGIGGSTPTRAPFAAIKDHGTGEWVIPSQNGEYHEHVYMY